MIDVQKAAHLQRELLRAAIDCCKPGGIIVYSTCSISIEENEAVVDYATRVRHIKVIDTGLPVTRKGIIKYKENRYNVKIAHTRRVYPHADNMDGFFIAKIKKIKNGVKDIYADVVKAPQGKKKRKEREG